MIELENVQRLKGIRLKLGLSQTQVAEMIGCRLLTVFRWEQNYFTPLPIYTRRIEIVLKRLEKKLSRTQRSF